MEKKINKIEAMIGTEPFLTTLKGEGPAFVADEPESLGGRNLGPNPHDLLVAALASCTCITIKMYANRKGWNLQEVNADVTMERMIENGVQTTSITQWLSFKGELDETQLQRLMAIADKCPVHKTLAPAINIETRLKN